MPHSEFPHKSSLEFFHGYSLFIESFKLFKSLSIKNKEKEIRQIEKKKCFRIFSNGGLAGTCFNFVNSIVGSGVIGK
jgi:hypothetical protein